MRVLVTWGSKAGGTEGIARIVGKTLRDSGHDVALLPADAVSDPGDFDAVVVGGALYAFRWHADARRLVERHVVALRRLPVWFFSSGPLDDSAERQEIPPVDGVSVLMERVGARGHVTFGGRLEPDAKGFPASAMAKKQSGDWRNPERVRDWAIELARQLPGAEPGRAIDPPGRSPARLVGHGLAGAAGCASLLALLLGVTGPGAALTIHALVAPLLFLAVAWHYFRARGARAPLPTALAFAGLALVADAVVVGAMTGGLARLGAAGFWLALALIVLVTWVTGFVLGFLPGVRGLSAQSRASSSSQARASSPPAATTSGFSGGS